MINYEQNQVFAERLNECLVQHDSIVHVVVEGEVDVDVGDLVVRLEGEVLVRIHYLLESSQHVLVAIEIIKSRNVTKLNKTNFKIKVFLMQVLRCATFSLKHCSKVPRTLLIRLPRNLSDSMIKKLHLFLADTTVHFLMVVRC